MGEELLLGEGDAAGTQRAVAVEPAREVGDGQGEDAHQQAVLQVFSAGLGGAAGTVRL